jgi:hypothetical protein
VRQPAARALGTAAALLLIAVVLASATRWRPAVEHDAADNTFVTDPGPAGLIDAHNSPTLARNPLDPDNLIVVHRVDRPDFSAVLHRTADGGQRWSSTALPLPPGKDRPFAPDAAFGPDGTLYVSYVNLAGPGNVPETLWVARSDDGGRTLSAPVAVADALTFQARLTVAPDGAVHVTYLDATDVGLLKLIGPAPIVAARSTDRGRTFSEPVVVSDPARTRVGAATPAIDASGDLVVLYVDFKDDVRDFENLEGPAWQNRFALVLTRSRDAGRSFAPGVEIESDVVPAKRFLVFLPAFPAIATGARGDVVVAWADARHGDQDVFVRRSGDGGQSWSEALRVNDNPQGDGTAQYLPAVDVAPNGRIDVLFLDRRRDAADILMDVTLASSSDGGRSFRNTPVSTASFDSRVGFSAAAYLEPDFGSRLGLATSDDAALAVWTDTRLGDQDSGRQDIVSTRVTVSRSPARQVLRLLTVAVVAAALALVAWVAGRRVARFRGSG